jgi:hypothetical protein
MFARLDRGTAPAVETLPGWFARRRTEVPAAMTVLDGIPAGAVIESTSSQSRPAARDRRA